MDSYLGKVKRYAFFILSFIIWINAYAQSPCEVRDRNALMAIYNALDGPNWINSTNWGTAAPLNTWYGISTDVNGCVIELDLNPTNTPAGNNGLTGTLPDELGNLLNLQFLDLTNQNITGDLPDTIGNLTALRWLELDYNEINGVIPNTIGQLINLEYLAIRSNNLTGPLPTEIGDLIALEYLVLDDNQISGEIPASLGNLSNLGALWLQNNQLSGSIPDSLENLGQLYQLLLGDNQLSGEIPDIFGGLLNLEGIWLNSNMLSGEIPQSIFQLNKLEQLLLYENQLTGTISSDFQYLTSLRAVYLGSNNFTGEIPSEIGSITTLQSIGFNDAQFSGEIPPELGNLPNLKILWLSNNNLTGTIPETFNGLYNLEQLAVGDNQLHGTVPSGFNQLPNLVALGLNNNYFEGPLPDFSQTLLDVLFFENNRFQFGDFEEQFDYYTNNLSTFIDNPQAKIDEVITQIGYIGGSITLTTNATGTQNHYQWFKDGEPIPNAPDSPNFTIDNLQASDSGVYYVEVTSDIVTDLTLIRHDITLLVDCQMPTADSLEDAIACGSFVLPELNDDNGYFTESNGMGVELNPGDEINSTQTIYIYIGTGVCSDESNFKVTILESVEVDQLQNVQACEGFELPELENGNYFSEPSGSGQAFFSGDYITSNGTIYIYDENEFCSDESSFTVTVLENVEVDELPNVEVCDGFELPELENGNYFSASLGAGQAYYSGETISSNGTIYIYNENEACFNESSFTITIDSTKCEIEEEEIIVFPKFFSPNNDGYNDVWKPNFEESGVSGYLYIYDRYGKLLKQMDANKGYWDGKYNGREMPATSYWFRFENGQNDQVQNGFFALIR